MLSSNKDKEFQNINIDKSRNINYNSQSPPSMQNKQVCSPFKPELSSVKEASSYKKLCTGIPQDPQRPNVTFNQSQIIYPQFFQPSLMQDNPVTPVQPNQMYLNTPQVSFGNMNQNQLYIPANFQMPNKNMTQIMVPNMAYQGAPNVCYQGVPQNNSCIIFMNQPTIIANQPITFNIQNNYNTAPPQYQQPPKIEYITNLYCPNSNNNVFTSDSWRS